MESPVGPPLKGQQERRGPSNLLWYVVGAAVVLAIVLTAVSTFPSVELSTSQFLELIDKEKAANQAKQAAPAEAVSVATQPDAKNMVVVSGKSKSKKETYGYFHLQEDLVIGSTSASGKVKRLKLDPNTLLPVDKEQTVSFYAKLNPDQVETLLKDLGAVEWDAARPPGPMETWGPFVVISLMFLGVLYVMMKRLGAQPAQFGRSRGKMYAQEDLGITFEHVAGIDEALEEVKEIVEFLREPEKFQKLGGRIPKGILLVGPPGTGKTLLARAIAGEAGAPFFGLSGSDFVEMFVGVGAARVRDTFEMAAAKAPCIIFIDELDALGKTRGSGIIGGHDEREQTLNALLVEMDGFDPNAGVIVMAATNRPETLDPALLRPGRFDRHVLVDKPDVKGREAILKVHAQNIKMAEGVRLKEIAEITSGFAGADLANLVNEAALLAARKGKSAVEMEEFDEAVERVTAGLEKKQRIVSEDEKIRVAYHESGHALVGHCLPNTDPVHKVSIIPRGLAALGYTLQRPEGDRFLMTQGELESRIQVLLAGTVAEELIFCDISTGASNDLERASEIARSMVMDFGMSRLGRICFRRRGGSAFLITAESQYEHTYSEQTAREIDDEVKRIIDLCIGKVRELLVTRKTALEALAKRLLEVEVVDAAELRRIMELHSAGPQIVPGTMGMRRSAAMKPESKSEGAADAPTSSGEVGA